MLGTMRIPATSPVSPWLWYLHRDGVDEYVRLRDHPREHPKGQFHEKKGHDHRRAWKADPEDVHPVADEKSRQRQEKLSDIDPMGSSGKL